MLHAAVATILQPEIGSNPGGRLPWDCAEHWRLAGDDARAIEVLRTCAQRASEIGRPQDALETFKRALALRCPAQRRLELLEGALSTIWFGLNFMDARELLQERRRVRAELKMPSDVHDGYELLEFAQVLHTDGDPRVNIERIRSCLTVESTTPNHRAQAAVQLLLIADLHRDVELAAFARRNGEDPTSDWVPQNLCHLVYETCFGDRQRAGDIASEMATHLRLYGAPDTTSFVGMLYNIGYAYYRVGDGILSRQHLKEALEVARRNEMIAAQIQVLSGLALLSWSTGQIDECRHWHDELQRFDSHSALVTAACDYYITGARLAVYDCRLRAAASFVERGRRLPQACLDAPRMLLLASEIRGRAGESEIICSDAEVSELLTFHARACELGEQDDIVVVLLNALIARGEKVEAEMLLGNYLRRRREGMHIHGPLQQAASRMQHLE
jgi:hypothetical protein